jgi:hypothetical protein
MIEINTPYVLSAFQVQLYSSNSVSSSMITPYTSNALLSQSGVTYRIVYTSQVGNLVTTSVFVSKGTSPYYNTYYCNTFVLTNTGAVGKMSATINETTGTLNVTKTQNNISADGAIHAIYLQMSNDNKIQYFIGSSLTGTATWTDISDTSWPITITNTNSHLCACTILNVVTTELLTISNTYGGLAGYFIAGSPYIIFGGFGNTINIDGITNYPGLIQNGTSTAGGIGFENVIVQNFITSVSGGSTLASSAGWLCQAYFGRNVLGNSIKACMNTGAINGIGAGGIAGQYVGSYGGSVSITSCTNTGDITSDATGAGGIVGTNLGYTNGLVSLSTCFSSGTIYGQYAGGITGARFAWNTKQLCSITNSYSTGDISGNNTGGIVGADVGYNNLAT